MKVMSRMWWAGLLAFGVPILLCAQVTCSGTFGDNIFTEGDFGRGAPNIRTDVSDIAPGYAYTTQTPPGDGFYTITNNMGRWSNIYGTWITVGDNSDDPSGYMMVVNASYSPGIFYEQTIDNLCPNTTFEFSADILNVVRSQVTGHSLPDLEFLINDSVWYSTGTIPQDEKWHKHGFTFALGAGETSLKLTLVNKAPGGTGNDLALDNITFRPCGPEPDLDLLREVIACEEDQNPVVISTQVDTSQFAIQWQSARSIDGQWQNTGMVNAVNLEQDLEDPGEYFYRYKLSNSAANLDNPYCVSYSDVVKATKFPRVFELWDTICMGNSRIFDSQNLTTPGRYEATFTSTRGCDSISVLHLEVVERRDAFFDLSIRDPLCHDSSDGRLEIMNVSGGYAPYRYEVGNQMNTTGVFDGLTAGVQSALITDHFGCMYDTVAELISPPPFELFPIQDTQLVLGQPLSIDISASEPVSMLTAEPDIFMECNGCQSVTFIPVQSTEVSITARNANNCASTEHFFISVDDQNLPISFPNAFTPDGDGINDLFQIVVPPHLVSRMISSRILDKWGNVVYAISDRMDMEMTTLWNGLNKDDLAEPGIYAYVCELELINGEIRIYTGEVLLIGASY